MVSIVSLWSPSSIGSRQILRQIDTECVMSHPAEQLLRDAGPTISVPALAQVYGCSASHIHDLINRGELDLPVIHLGKRRVIPTAAVREKVGLA